MQEIKARPKKEGWLKKQINSFFDIWNTRYFYLDGTNFCYFYDDNTDIPRKTINLKGCFVDGIWPKDSLYTFTVRSIINDDVFYYLGAFSAGEAEEWLRNLKSAITMIEYEEVIQETYRLREPSVYNNEFLDNMSDIAEEKPANEVFKMKNRDNNPSVIVALKPEYEMWEYLLKTTNEARKVLPPQLEIAYEDYVKYLKDTKPKLSFLLCENDMTIYEINDDPKFLILKGIHYLDHEVFSLIKVLKTDLHEILWNTNCKKINLHKRVQENISVYEAQYDMIFKQILITFKDTYITQSWLNDKVFNIVRASLKAGEKNIINDIFRINLDLDLVGIRIKDIDCGYQKSKLTILIKTKRRNMMTQYLIRKFLLRYMLAFSYFKIDLPEVDLQKQIKWQKDGQILEKIAVDQITLESDSIGTKMNSNSKANLRRSSLEESKIVNEQISNKIKTSALEKKNEIMAIKKNTNEMQLIQGKKRQIDRKAAEIFKDPTHLQVFEQIQSKLKSKGIILREELLCRFLRGKGFNLKEVEDVISRYWEWKQEINIDTMDLDDPSFISYVQRKIIVLLGHDKLGQPIIFIRANRYIPRETPEIDFRRYFSIFLNDAIFSMPEDIECYIVLIDCKNITYQNSSLTQLKEILPIIQSYYPDYAYKIIFINPNMIFKYLYMGVKPFLNERTLKKLIIGPGNQKEIYKLLSQYMDHNIIPKEYGGENDIQHLKHKQKNLQSRYIF